MQPESVCAVVVTHNRYEMLTRCLAALEAQTRQVDAILVVDNASTDGTPERLAADHPSAELHRLGENVGGSGGFEAGVAEGVRRGHRWLWLMDDDVLPADDALEQLLTTRDRLAAVADPVVLASRVEWKDEQLHPTNLPGIDFRRYYETLESAAERALPLRWSSFVSVMIRTDAIARHGLPLGRYFIWFDDVEYTARILRDEPGFFVPRSVVRHHSQSRYTTPSGMGDRFYYSLRNRIFVLRGPALRPLEKLRLMKPLLADVASYSREHEQRGRALATVARGLRDGLRTPARELRPAPAPAPARALADVVTEA